jgi:hypothetical protein
MAMIMGMAVIMRMIVAVMGVVVVVIMAVFMIAVIMMMVVVAMVVMMMTMAMRGVIVRRCIGAALGIERRFDGDHFDPEAARHFLDDVIAADAQSAAGQFDRKMAIAQMPSDAGERDGVLAADFRERLRRGDDFDDPSVLERQAIAGAQQHGFRQIEEKGEATHARHRKATTIAVVVVEDDGIGGSACPRAGGANGTSGEHGRWDIRLRQQRSTQMMDALNVRPPLPALWREGKAVRCHRISFPREQDFRPEAAFARGGSLDFRFAGNDVRGLR